MVRSEDSELLILMGLWLVALALSGVAPHDRLTWFLEVAPVLVAIPLVAATRRRYPLSRLLIYLIFIHGLILILGGHYTYARVPLGFWVHDAFDLARNHYDRLGHFAQGFIPAILAREILLRNTALRPGKMLAYIVLSICLAFSAFYELIEWWAAAALGQDADAFLGTQGDVWDTQWDMFMALSGAAAALACLSRWHDRQLGAV
ncbi:MAG: DUF2238 domain-containing protein [Magnetovibrio sp.]|nr:DUF2238 domain-containing protein [Magnetovibrio sp.]